MKQRQRRGHCEQQQRCICNVRLHVCVCVCRCQLRLICDRELFAHPVLQAHACKLERARSRSRFANVCISTTAACARARVRLHKCAVPIACLYKRTQFLEVYALLDDNDDDDDGLLWARFRPGLAVCRRSATRRSRSCRRDEWRGRRTLVAMVTVVPAVVVRFAFSGTKIRFGTFVARECAHGTDDLHDDRDQTPREHGLIICFLLIRRSSACANLPLCDDVAVVVAVVVVVYVARARRCVYLVRIRCEHIFIGHHASRS